MPRGAPEYDPGMGLGRILLQTRTERGFTQQHLAEMAGISKSAIATIESGKVTSPAAYTVYRLALALRIPMEDLMGVSRLASRTRMRSYPDERVAEILKDNFEPPISSPEAQNDAGG